MMTRPRVWFSRSVGYLVCGIVVAIALAAPPVAVACPCAAVSHALIWKRQHHVAPTGPTIKSTGSILDPSLVLVLAVAPLVLVALVFVPGRRDRARARAQPTAWV
jgi:hypothetical protein